MTVSSPPFLVQAACASSRVRGRAWHPPRPAKATIAKTACFTTPPARFNAGAYLFAAAMTDPASASPFSAAVFTQSSVPMTG